MVEFTWIASYPKSGCTWLRFIVAHLLFSTENGIPNVRDTVPDMHDYIGNLEYAWQGAYITKTHLCPDGLPPRMHTRSAIHIMRNPLDVVDSAIAYLRPASIEKRNELIDAFSDHGSIEPWYTHLGYGTWQENVTKWREGKHDFPILLLRYEDMLADTNGNIRKLADFFEVDISDKRVEEIVQATSFSSMRAREDEELTTKATGVFNDEQLEEKPDFRFMRSGKSGSYSENLSEEEITRLTDFFRPYMEAQGYL